MTMKSQRGLEKMGEGNGMTMSFPRRKINMCKGPGVTGFAGKLGQRET